jgi:hypothetical protein
MKVNHAKRTKILFDLGRVQVKRIVLIPKYEVADLKRVKNTSTVSGLNQAYLIAFTVFSAIVPAVAEPGKPDYAANVTRMDEILKTKPNDESAHYYRAVSLQNLGQYQRAKADYEWVSMHAKNPTLIQYSTTALRNLSPSAGTHTQSVLQRPLALPRNLFGGSANGGGTGTAKQVIMEHKSSSE